MTNDIARQILQRGLDDWVPLVSVVSAVRQSVEGDDEARVQAEALVLLADLSRAGLVRIGEVSDGGFFEFPGALDEVLSEIDGAWNGKEDPQWWFICWVENTGQGDRLARREDAR